MHFKRDNFGYVENSELDTLIESDAIYAFKRASGWVQIGKDPIRSTGVKQHYKGPLKKLVGFKEITSSQRLSACEV